MNTIKKKIILFTSGLLAILLSLNLISVKLMDVVNNRQFRQDKELAQKDSIDYLFIGSSRLNRDIDEKLIPGSYQYFGAAETTPYHYYRLEHALKVNTDIDFSILPAETGMLAFSEIPFLYLGIYWRQHLDVWEFAKNSDDFLRYLFLGLKMKTLPFYQLPKLGLFYWDALSKRNTWKELQQESYDQYGFYEKQVILNAFLAQHLSYAKLITEPGVNYFTKIIELSEERKHPIIFLKYPLTEDYRNAINQNFPEIMQSNQKMDSMIAVSPYARVVDFTDVYDNQHELFIDPHHLNQTGKEKFSKLVNDTLSSIKQSGWPHETGN